MADSLHGLTQFANIIPTNFAPAVEGFMRSDLTLANMCYDASKWSTGAGSITYPVPGKLTAAAKTSETKLTEHISASDPDAKATIAMSTIYAVPLFFELVALKQVYSNPGLLAEFAERGGYALREAFETYIAGIIQSATTNDFDLATDNTVLFADIAKAWGKLGNLNIKPRDTAIGMSGVAWALSMADWGTNYLSAATLGNNQNFLSTGAWGMLGQSPLYISADWGSVGTADEEACSVWHRAGVGYAIQGGVDILGPTPDVLGAGMELGLYLNGGAVKAVDTFIVNIDQKT